MHVAVMEEFAEYAARVKAGTAGNAIDRMWSYKDLDRLRNSASVGAFRAGPYDIHHIVEKRVQEVLGIPVALRNEVPGIPLPRKSGVAGFDPIDYAKKFGHAPIYHQNTAGGAQGIVGAIGNAMPNPPFDRDARRLMLVRLKLLYNENPAFKNANMWPVARDWLKKHMPNDADLLDIID